MTSHFKPLPSGEEISFDSLMKRIQRMEDIDSIKQLQSTYQYWLTTGRFEQIAEHCFPKAKGIEDVRVEASDSGVFRGPQGIHDFFVKSLGGLRNLPGSFIWHMSVNSIIEIARDRQTARAIFISPGVTSTPPAWASFAYGIYYNDYIQEEGEWKMWHVNFNIFFRSPADGTWHKQPIDKPLAKSFNGASDPPSNYHPYSPDTPGWDLFKHLPDVPVPYDSWSEEIVVEQ
jgi:SnoaL-like domain